MSELKIKIVENILNANDELAKQNRLEMERSRLFSINIMASPGAGKTSLIEKTIKSLADKYKILVIDGDIATTLDADRASAAGADAIQINTGGDCHLDAVMLSRALRQISCEDYDLLLVENVGNLVCPASFDLGTSKNILIASVPEGDDKPHKYPSMYRGVDVVILNKVDLFPYVDFNREFFYKGIQALNPGVEIFNISCRTGEGLQAWFDWLSLQIDEYRNGNNS